MSKISNFKDFVLVNSILQKESIRLGKSKSGILIHVFYFFEIIPVNLLNFLDSIGEASRAGL